MFNDSKDDEIYNLIEKNKELEAKILLFYNRLKEASKPFVSLDTDDMFNYDITRYRGDNSDYWVIEYEKHFSIKTVREGSI